MMLTITMIRAMKIAKVMTMVMIAMIRNLRPESFMMMMRNYMV